jgi:hypothetical protein
VNGTRREKQKKECFSAQTNANFSIFKSEVKGISFKLAPVLPSKLP